MLAPMMLLRPRRLASSRCWARAARAAAARRAWRGAAHLGDGLARAAARRAHDGLAGVVEHDDRRALHGDRLEDHVEDLLEDLRQRLLAEQRGARLAEQLEDARLAPGVARVHRAVGDARVQVLDAVGLRAVERAALDGLVRRARREHEAAVAQRDEVAVGEAVLAHDAGAVEEGAVRAPEIDDVEAVDPLLDLGVPPREAVIGQEDVALLAPPDDQSAARNRKTPAFSRSSQKLDFRHADPSERPVLIP